MICDIASSGSSKDNIMRPHATPLRPIGSLPSLMRGDTERASLGSYTRGFMWTKHFHFAPSLGLLYLCNKSFIRGSICLAIQGLDHLWVQSVVSHWTELIGKAGQRTADNTVHYSSLSAVHAQYMKCACYKSSAVLLDSHTCHQLKIYTWLEMSLYPPRLNSHVPR